MGGLSGYHLGIDLGTAYTGAAIHRDGKVEFLTLGNRASAVPSVVLLREDESILAGDAANRRGLTEPDRVAREFKRRVGDPTPLILGGSPYSAEALMAKLLRWTVDRVTELEGGPPDAVAVTHPANWGPYKQDLLDQVVRLADLDAVTTLTEPEAAAVYYASQERVEPGSVIAVYDLGGGTFDAAVLRKTEEGWEILGAPEGIERLGGIDFDEAVFTHVRRALPEEFEGLDPDDPRMLSAVARIRDDCIEAKEALSADTDVSIAVPLPSVQTEVRLTREEFEGMIRPALQETVGAMRRALRSAEVDPAEVSTVLLVGGSSRIPLVAQLIGAEFGRPVAVDAHPKHAIALGAALAVAPGTGVAAAGVESVAARASEEPEHPAEAAVLAPALATAGAADTVGGKAPVLPSSPDSVQKAGRSRLLTLTGAAAAVAIVLVVAGLQFLGGPEVSDADTIARVEPTAEAVTDIDEAPVDEGPVTRDPEETEADPGPSVAPRRQPFAEITDIAVRDGRFVLTYEATGFTPLMHDAGAFHVHFFWDTLPVMNAGTNGPDPGRWLIWDTPFEVSNGFFDLANRPQGARHICTVVADNGHAVADVTGNGEPDLDTGGCIELPDG